MTLPRFTIEQSDTEFYSSQSGMALVGLTGKTAPVDGITPQTSRENDLARQKRELRAKRSLIQVIIIDMSFRDDQVMA